MDNEQDFSHVTAWGNIEGEEHIPQLLHNESGLVNKLNVNLATTTTKDQ